MTATTNREELSDRMKGYENSFRYYLTAQTPVIVRVDGRAFHTYTKQFNRPFDPRIIDAMIYAATKVAEDMQGFKAAYIQSDEASFLITDYDDEKTEGWFSYNLNKIVSNSASIMTANFNHYLYSHMPTVNDLAIFDSRAFNVPKEDVSNYFLWRTKDWERNSLQMYCRSVFSHRQLEGKKKDDMLLMLKSVGKDWHTDLANRLKYGTFLLKTDKGIEVRDDIISRFVSVDGYIGKLL